MKDLYIIGAGGFGREVAGLVEHINSYKEEWNLKGFVDDNKESYGEIIDEYPVVGGCEWLGNLNENVWAVCAVGNTRVKKFIVDKVKKFCNVKFATLVDPSAVLLKNINIDEGSIICAGVMATVDIKIGKHVIVNLGCTIGHDCVIEDYATVYPGANISGNVIIGEKSEIGTGAKIIQGKKIVKDVILGAGAVVVKDINKSGTYVGVPAKQINE